MTTCIFTINVSKIVLKHVVNEFDSRDDFDSKNLRPTNFNVEKATNFVLNPGSASELCVLSEDSATEGGIRQRNNTRDNDDLPVNPTRKNLHVKEPV